MHIGGHMASRGPLWMKIEAQSRPPVVLPPFRLIHRLVSPPGMRDKREICDRFCQQSNFVEIRWLRAEKSLARFVLPELEQPHRTAREIIRLVADKHELGVDDVLCASRKDAVVIARHEAYYEIARLKPEFSLPMIGKAMAGRDHTTVLSGIRRHIERGAPSIRGLQPKPKHSNYVPRGTRLKWTKEKVDEALRLRADGLSLSEAAEAMGERRSALSKALIYWERPSKST